MKYHYDTAEQFVGKALGTSDWETMGQARIDTFAECTGDHQWIHVDQERCRNESPFGTTIAHGFLNLSLLGGLMMQMGVMPAGVRHLVNAGVNNVRFRGPVRAGKRVRACVSVHAVADKGEGRKLLTLLAQLEVEGELEPALSAECVALIFRQADSPSTDT
ncbi:putative enoyl-CoA hydratase 1 [compost metagenome]